MQESRDEMRCDLGNYNTRCIVRNSANKINGNHSPSSHFKN
jgi:hypothetical protein